MDMLESETFWHLLTSAFLCSRQRVAACLVSFSMIFPPTVFWRHAYSFDLVSTFFFWSFLFESQGTEQLPTQLS